MTLKEPRSREGLVANWAGVLEAVGEDVHGEGGHADVDLAAVGTLLGHLRVHAPVGLLVARKVGGGCIVLAAFVAGVPCADFLRKGTDGGLFSGSAICDEERIVGVAYGDPCLETVSLLGALFD